MYTKEQIFKFGTGKLSQTQYEIKNNNVGIINIQTIDYKNDNLFSFLRKHKNNHSLDNK